MRGEYEKSTLYMYESSRNTLHVHKNSIMKPIKNYKKMGRKGGLGKSNRGDKLNQNTMYNIWKHHSKTPLCNLFTSIKSFKEFLVVCSIAHIYGVWCHKLIHVHNVQ
jgi:hypothetical protein